MCTAKKPFFVGAEYRLLPQPKYKCSLFISPVWSSKFPSLLKFPIELRTKVNDGVELRSFTA
jgi:hypothetical protein